MSKTKEKTKTEKPWEPKSRVKKNGKMRKPDFSIYAFKPKELRKALAKILDWMGTNDKTAILTLIIDSMERAANYEEGHGSWGNQEYIRAVRLQVIALLEKFKAEKTIWNYEN
jgi:hypothetical protein